jgi:hypothetical protein
MILKRTDHQTKSPFAPRKTVPPIVAGAAASPHMPPRTSRDQINRQFVEVRIIGAIILKRADRQIDHGRRRAGRRRASHPWGALPRRFAVEQTSFSILRTRGAAPADQMSQGVDESTRGFARAGKGRPSPVRLTTPGMVSLSSIPQTLITTDVAGQKLVLARDLLAPLRRLEARLHESAIHRRSLR